MNAIIFDNWDQVPTKFRRKKAKASIRVEGDAIHFNTAAEELLQLENIGAGVEFARAADGKTYIRASFSLSALMLNLSQPRIRSKGLTAQLNLNGQYHLEDSEYHTWFELVKY